MGCCNEIANALDTTVFEPTQHVNFAKGMVLGVDDFRQEFAYLSGRDEWLARDAVGYGTLSGLRVFVEDGGTDGPRLHVTGGSALAPSGKHICVGADQCAAFNKWLAKPANAAIVTQLLNAGLSSPPYSPPFSPPLSPPAVTSGAISLYLTLCYADCTAFPVPVPGEPCRTEADLMADSRVVDDFRLELRKDPPAQVEEDALRDFVRWLHMNVTPGPGSPTPADEASWIAALRAAVQPWLDAGAMSPPASPPASVATLGDYLFDLSPGALEVAPEQMCDFLRVAFRFWVTELRPLWMARRCHVPVVKDQDCVLLARIELEVDFVGGSPAGTWQVVGSPTSIVVDESKRPFLVHLRMLQEWMMCGCECTTGPGTAFAMGGGGGGGGGGLGGGFGGGGPGPMMVPLIAHASTQGVVPVLVTSGDLTLLPSHYCVICQGASGTVKFSLPPTASNAGRMYVFKNVDAATLNVTAAGSDKVEDKATLTLKATLALKKKEAATIIADGQGAWRLIGDV